MLLEGVTEGSGFSSREEDAGVWKGFGTGLGPGLFFRSGGALSWGSSGCSFPFPMGRAWSQGIVGISIPSAPSSAPLPATRGGSSPWSLLGPAKSCSWQSRSHPGHTPGQGSTRGLP